MIVCFSLYKFQTKWKNTFNHICKLFSIVGLSFLIYCGCENHGINNNLNNNGTKMCNTMGCIELAGEITLTNVNFSLKSDKTYQIQISMGTCTITLSKKVVDKNNTLIFSRNDITLANCSSLSTVIIADGQKKMIKIEFYASISLMGEKQTFFMNLKMFENGAMIVDSGELEISNLSEYSPNGVGCEPICYRVTTTISLRESKDE